MSDDKQKDITKGPDPKQRAFNKVQEGINKEFGAKVEQQVKNTIDAIRAAATEKAKLAMLLQEMDAEKQVTSDIINQLK